MSWHKRDDDYWTSPKIALAGEDAALVFDVLLGINSRRKRGGKLQAEDLHLDLIQIRLGCARRSLKQIRTALDRCETVELLEIEPDGSATIVGFDEEWSPKSGPSSSGTKSANAERQARHRNAKRNGVSVTRNASSNGDRNVTRNGDSNADRNAEVEVRNSESVTPQASRASGSGREEVEGEKTQTSEGGGGGRGTSLPKGSGEPGSRPVLGSQRFAPRYVLPENLDDLGPEVGEPQPILGHPNILIRRREREGLAAFSNRRAHTLPPEKAVKS